MVETDAFKRHIGNALDADLTGFDFVWASPPCQAHTALKHVTGKEYECYIERTREKLKAWGGLYIIENVMGAPLENPVMLCGSSFGLRVRRHRIFESNVTLTVPACNHAAQPEPIDVSGTGSAQLGERKKKTGGKCRKPKNLDEAREIMGMPWATRKEIAQAIPPAFAEHLARQIMGALTAANDPSSPTAGGGSGGAQERQPMNQETSNVESAPAVAVQRVVSRRRTGYKDKNGKTIREGDTLEGNFTAPWDEEVWITRRFKVVKDPSGRWLCDGDKSNDENDWLANFKHLEVVKPANDPSSATRPEGDSK